MILIRAWTNANKLIEWEYDTHQQAAPFWKKLTETGRTPDTNDGLSRAYYWGPNRRKGDGPDKAWAP